jgi:cytochrome c
VRNLVSTAIVGCAALIVATPAHAQDVEALLKKNSCTMCHKVDGKSGGPSYKQMVDEYGKDADAPALLADRIKNGSAKIWGPNPMPAFPKLADADVAAIVKWILSR